MLLVAYGVVVQLAPPVYGAFLWRRATARGAIAGLVTGSVVTGFFVLMPDWKPLAIHEGLLGLVANVAALVVVSLLTPPPPESHVTAWFATSRAEDR